jgi:hypothetical protein
VVEQRAVAVGRGLSFCRKADSSWTWRRSSPSGNQIGIVAVMGIEWCGSAIPMFGTAPALLAADRSDVTRVMSAW